jgi:hypothetical protein
MLCMARIRARQSPRGIDRHEVYAANQGLGTLSVYMNGGALEYQSCQPLDNRGLVLDLEGRLHIKTQWLRHTGQTHHGFMADLERFHGEEALDGSIRSGWREPSRARNAGARAGGGTGSYWYGRRDRGRLGDSAPNRQRHGQRQPGRASTVGNRFLKAGHRGTPCQESPQRCDPDRAHEVRGVHPQYREQLSEQTGTLVTQVAGQNAGHA